MPASLRASRVVNRTDNAEADRALGTRPRPTPAGGIGVVAMVD